MKDNNKIAKQLLRIAKELCGANNAQGETKDFDWYVMVYMPIEQCLVVLERCINLVKTIMPLRRGDDISGDYEKIKENLKMQLKNCNDEFKKLNEEDLDKKVVEILEEVKRRLSLARKGTNKSVSFLSIQRYMQSLVSIPDFYAVVRDRAGKFYGEHKNNAVGLMFRLNYLINCGHQEKGKREFSKTCEEELAKIVEKLKELHMRIGAGQGDNESRKTENNEHRKEERNFLNQSRGKKEEELEEVAKSFRSSISRTMQYIQSFMKKNIEGNLRVFLQE